MDKDTKRRDERRAYVVFISSVASLLVVLFIGITAGVTLRNSALFDDIILERGRAYFKQIVLTRRWAAGYGGVYVRKGPGVESNPWLEHPDLVAADGSVLTLRNPALITREISELASMDGDFSFHITSLKPINPGNAPDEFEADALMAFEDGATERWGHFDDDGGRYFRYMGALSTEASCLACHAAQGYEVGDVRGGISVTFPIESIHRQMRQTLALTLSLAAAILFLTIGAILVIVSRLRKELTRLGAELEKAATTDPLTELYNRRFLMERLEQEVDKSVRTGQPLCCAMIDVDDFKKINDRYGHAAGDAVLRGLADTLRAETRSYDVAARYGGEEFFIAFPGVEEAAALGLCDRIRVAVPAGCSGTLPGGKPVTVSVGVAAMEPPGPEAGEPRTSRADLIESLLRHADAALYEAKAAGKDRCAAYRPS
ncbi:MAG: diguanylate cyclase [Spirochaetaceae bacterium]|nr:diguanylate cyclase [Spirochaetaceae bacterium]